MVKKPFKYTHVGRLPEDWDCLQAIEVIDEISMGPFGSDITVSNFVSSGVPVLNGYNVSQIKANAFAAKDHVQHHVEQRHHAAQRR